MADRAFSDRLKQAMAQAGMKQVDVLHRAQAEGVKLGKSQLSQYVSGKTIPRPATMNFLSRALNVS
ncbi:MAG: helix-turn-helix domain-containing protein, partial [Eggerthellaceae bacterium]|nr:helix-turn-helix domain-containing protein [Eggerthellaceae bacterium]